MAQFIYTDEEGIKFDKEWAGKLYETYWKSLEESNVKELHKVRDDLFTWRRGSAQMVLKTNPGLGNFSIYSVLATGVQPSIELYRHLLNYNILQRRECLGLFDKDGHLYVVLKYTMELELVTPEVLQRHIYALQEIADDMDTNLVKQFGGSLHFEEWKTMEQSAVDDLLGNLFD